MLEPARTRRVRRMRSGRPRHDSSLLVDEDAFQGRGRDAEQQSIGHGPASTRPKLSQINIAINNLAAPEPTAISRRTPVREISASRHASRGWTPAFCCSRRLHNKCRTARYRCHTRFATVQRYRTTRSRFTFDVARAFAALRDCSSRGSMSDRGERMGRISRHASQSRVRREPFVPNSDGLERDCGGCC
jgi:hypothetical protein